MEPPRRRNPTSGFRIGGGQQNDTLVDVRLQAVKSQQGNKEDGITALVPKHKKEVSF
jgi:hypothetical protein